MRGAAPAPPMGVVNPAYTTWYHAPPPSRDSPMRDSHSGKFTTPAPTNGIMMRPGASKIHPYQRQVIAPPGQPTMNGMREGTWVHQAGAGVYRPRPPRLQTNVIQPTPLLDQDQTPVFESAPPVPASTTGQPYSRAPSPYEQEPPPQFSTYSTPPQAVIQSPRAKHIDMDVEVNGDHDDPANAILPEPEEGPGPTEGNVPPPTFPYLGRVLPMPSILSPESTSGTMRNSSGTVVKDDWLNAEGRNDQ